MSNHFFARRVLDALRIQRSQPAQLQILRDIATRSLALSGDNTAGGQEPQDASKEEPTSTEEPQTEGGAPAFETESLEAENSEAEEEADEAPSASPAGAEDYDDEDEKLTEEDKEMLRRLSKEAWETLQQQVFGDGEDLRPVANLAGTGRSGWQNLWHSEEDGRYWWALDLTGGKVPENGRNALLCQESKLLMGIMYKNGIPVEEIASYFRVRQQRVMAILALQKIDAQHVAEGNVPFTAVQQAMEGGPMGEPGYFQCNEVIGSGERHVRLLPRAPHYEVDVDKKGNIVKKDFDALEEQVAAQEDKMMIEEFKERLAYNMGEAGKGLRRDVRGSHRPKRPKGGFGLVVKPKSKEQQPFVALADGTRRELNEDEAVLQNRRQVRRRRRFM